MPHPFLASLVPPSDAHLLPLLTLLVSLLQAPPYTSSAHDASLNTDDTSSLALPHLLSRRFQSAAIAVRSPLPPDCLSTGFVASQAKPLPFARQSLARLLPDTH